VVHSYNVNILLILAAIASAIGGIIAWVIILIDAFNDEWWKALLFLFIPFYAFFYAIFEFEHDRKWEIVCLFLAGTALSLAFLKMAS